MLASLAPVIEPGFFSSGPVQVALLVGAVVAVVSGPVGVFTVLRGQSFAGHALSDIGTAGGSGAYLAGVGTIYGFVVGNLLAGGVMELIGIRRARGRDVATGIVLGGALGLAALFLYLSTTETSTTGATVNVLFGSVFTLERSTVPLIIGLASVAVALIAVLYRPLILASVSPDLAAARGVSVRLVGIGYLAALALAVSLSAVTIGSIMSTALLIGPAAAAVRVCRRIATAVVTAAVLGVASVWLAILLAYDSYDWTSAHQGWPVSFFVVALIFLAYLTCAGSRRQERSPAEAS